MKKLYIIFLLLSIIQYSYAQLDNTGATITETAESFTFGQHMDENTSYDYTASEYIKLVEGQGLNFEYSPNGDNYFIAKNNPLMVFPPTEGTEGGPNLGDDGVVGAIPGNLSVSPTGAAVYTIPIDLPQGTAGMTPQLSLTYNSQAGNGLLGIGWSLAGVSNISRTGTTIYNEGYIDGVDFDSNDKFALDGNRLIPVSGGEYRTERETFSKTISHFDANDNIDWFEVWTKGGQIIEYGHTPDSKIETQGSVIDVLIWQVNRIKDRKGNYIDFTYYENNSTGEFHINSIKYTGNINTAQTTYYTITFNYSYDRDDKNRYNNAGAAINITALLETIDISYQDNSVRTYGFDYGFDSYTHLVGLTIIGESNKHFNATKFEWTTETEDIEIINSGYDNGVAYYYGDFNGDGKTDYVTTNILEGEWYLYENIGNGNFSFLNSGVLSENFVTLNGSQAILGQTAGKYSIDFDGDGNGDLLWRETYYDPDLGDQYLYILFCSDPVNNDFHSSLTPIYAPINHDLRIGDFNGDGCDDIFVLDNNYNSGYDWQVYFYPGRTISWDEGNYDPGGLDWTSNGNVGDYNGDGKMDIMVLNQHIDNPCIILEYQGESFVEMQVHGYPTAWHDKVLSGDFNGDGITDILTHSGSGWELRLQNGTDWEAGEDNNLAPNLNTPFGGVLHFVGDYNGDGKSDILEVIPFGSSNSYLKVFYSNGLSFTTEANLVDHPLGYLVSPFVFGDFNGDGKMDIKYDHTYYQKMIFFHPDEKKHLINNISNAFNSNVSIIYETITDNSIYEKGTGATYPVMDFQGALFVVDNIENENGNGGHINQQYTYKGAKIHKEGKGFLCFSEIRSKVVEKNLLDIKNYGYNSTYYYPHLLSNKTKILIGSDERLKTETNFYNHLHDYGSKRIFVFDSTIITNNYEIGGIGTVEYVKTDRVSQDYSSSYGNLIKYSVLSDPDELNINDPFTEYDFIKVTKTGYAPANTVSWVVNLLTTNETYQYAIDEATKYFKVNYYYYPEGSPHYPQLEFSLIDINSHKTIYSYDDYGNVTTINIPALNDPTVEGRVTTFEYSEDYQHRFMTMESKTCNGIDHITEYSYFPVSGRLKSVTDENGLVTNYGYDAFGRLTETIYPDNSQSKSVLRWSTGHPDTKSNSIYYNWHKMSGSSATLVFYDKFGREVRNVSTNFNNDVIYIDKEYDNLGRLIQSTDPYIKGTASIATTYSYDAFNRPTTITLPSDPGAERTTYFSYNGLETTTEDMNGNQIIKRHYSSGWLKEMEDTENHITKYSYTSFGKIKEIEDPAGNVFSFEYDEMMHRNAYQDPNAGIKFGWKFNTFGELYWILKDDVIKEVTTYDELGRVKTEFTVDGLSVEYFYDTKENGIGKIDYISHISENSCSMPPAILNSSEHYYYDTYGRLKNKELNIDYGGSNEQYVYKNTFDIFGRQKTLEYPNGFKVTNYFDEKGYLRNIRANNGNKLWEMDNIDVYGRITDYSLGNNLSIKHTYDPVTGSLTNIETGAGQQQNNVQNLEYNWLPHGVMDWRKDKNKLGNGAYFEDNFSYDNLYRLTDIITNGTSSSITYDTEGLGNIESKTGVGTYSYGVTSGGPHSLSSISDIPDDLVNLGLQTVDYTVFDKVCHITENIDGTDVNLDIIYGPGKQRIKQLLDYGNGNVVSKTYVGGLFEVTEQNGDKKELCYIDTPTGLSAIYQTENGGQGNLYYVTKDHLGSIDHICDESGNIVQELSFDAWGNRRDPATWQQYTEQPVFMLNRGYTGHEHLDDFGLINMNGRVYDPLVSRFLSIDGVMSISGGAQGLNRYTYANNNPLVYTDPNGELAVLLPALIGAVIGGGQAYLQGQSAGLSGSDLTWATITGAVSGGFSGALGAYAGGGGGPSLLKGDGFVNGFANGAAAGALSGGISGAAMTGTWDGAWQGVKSGAIIGGVSGGISGGISAASDDRDFWTGKNKIQRFYYVDSNGKTIPKWQVDKWEKKAENAKKNGKTIPKGHQHMLDRINIRSFKDLYQVGDEANEEFSIDLSNIKYKEAVLSAYGQPAWDLSTDITVDDETTRNYGSQYGSYKDWDLSKTSKIDFHTYGTYYQKPIPNVLSPQLVFRLIITK